MRAQRIRWWVYALAITLGIVGGITISVIENHVHMVLTGAPWIVPIVMIIIAIVIVYAAWQVHRYTNTERRKRAGMREIDPQRAVTILALSKMIAVVGALLLGWYGGQIMITVSHFEAPYYRTITLQCIFAAVASLIDMIAGIISEGFCMLPPHDGPEHPRTQHNQQRITS